VESRERGRERVSLGVKRVRNGVEERVPAAQYRDRNKLGITLDLSRPEEERTHLGRSVVHAADGGAGTILLRKIDANLSTLTSSTWTVLVPLALAFLVFLTWRPRGLLEDVQRRIPGLRACLIGVLLVCVLGMAVNDSGVAVPAMACGVLLPYIAYLEVRVQVRTPPPRLPVAIEATRAAKPELAKGRSG